ncbi:FAD-dependent oxidoreductase [Terasakiella sp. A23]|uniref:FAD-dependent oxidoreductase n=1 Tax=Terasakiella sp. FCG-A23 TaxID=3080561 RepID=UPI002955DDAE|nr:FAD-dependent oxidoreductase [Terasakiella sp. A23]MDV7338781.1 FAD-dependent oxidoreductase [Terasakiella sp. A23]
MLIKGYRDSFEYLDMIGARDQVAAYPGGVFEMREGPLHWQVPARGFLKAIMTGAVPGVGLFNLKGKTAYRRVWEPLVLAIFNARPDQVSGKLLWQTFREVLKQGAEALIPYFARTTLHDAFVGPALKQLDIKTNMRLLTVSNDRLSFKDHQIELDENNKAILALPQHAYAQVENPFQIKVMETAPITNIHFYLDHPVRNQFFGLVNTLSQWVYANDNLISVTISNFKPQGDDLAERVWRELCFHFDKAEAQMPPFKVICEKTATPLQDKNFVENRLKTETQFPNLRLAGDWIDTALPATIESAIRSGKVAAQTIF